MDNGFYVKCNIQGYEVWTTKKWHTHRDLNVGDRRPESGAFDSREEAIVWVQENQS